MSDRVKFMISFASHNPDTYRAGDWMNVRDDLKHFFNPGDTNTDFGFVANEGLAEASDDDIKSAQAHLQGLLQGFAGPRPEVLSNEPLRTVLGRNHSVWPVRVTYSSWKTPGRITVGKDSLRGGTLKDIVLAIAGSLLSDPAAKSIGYCPECEGVFLREGKQIFCSRTCTNRAMVKRKRAGLAKPRDQQSKREKEPAKQSKGAAHDKKQRTKK